MSSRQMKPEEKKQIEDEGPDVIEIIVCYGALGIGVHESCPLNAVSMDQLHEVWATGGIQTWKALGADKTDGEIALAGSKSNTGQFEFFMGLMRPPNRRLVEGITELDSDAAILEWIAETPLAMGYVRPGERNGKVKLLPVIAKAGTKPVAPTAETISGGTYPLSRPLYFYTTRPAIRPLQEFLAFVKSDAGRKIIEEEGFTPLPAKAGPAGDVDVKE